jgi:hypothetical protein
VQQRELRELGRQARRGGENFRRVLDMALGELLLLGAQGSLALEQLRGQSCLADVLQQSEQAEQLELLARELQEAGEYQHVDRYLDGARVGLRPLLPQPRNEQHGVRVAYHAVGEPLDRLLDLLGVQHPALPGGRLEELCHGREHAVIFLHRRLELGLDAGFLGIRGAALDGERRGGWTQGLASLEIDEHVLAELPERSELLLRAQVKPLEHERCFGPRAVELRDVHAELQLLDRELLSLHRSILRRIAPSGAAVPLRRARQGNRHPGG